MIDREKVLATIDTAYAARRSGDMKALASVVAGNAVFELVGDKDLLSAFPAAGPMKLDDAARVFHDFVALPQLDRLAVVVEGRRAAILWRAELGFGDRAPFQTMLFDLWELDSQGRIIALTQFADTGRIAQEMAAFAA